MELLPKRKQAYLENYYQYYFIQTKTKLIFVFSLTQWVDSNHSRISFYFHRNIISNYLNPRPTTVFFITYLTKGGHYDPPGNLLLSTPHS